MKEEPPAPPGSGGGGRKGGSGDDGSYRGQLHLGAQIAIALILGLYAGDWLDARTGWSPFFTLAGTVLGIALGMAVVIREVGRDQR